VVSAEIDAARLLARVGALGRISASPPPAVTRLAWSAEWREAADLLLEWAAQAGARAWVDPVGNVIAERSGAETSKPPLVTGSHLDTVPGGGTLDGAYGVVAAWEVLACLHDAGVRLRHPVRAVAFVNEEGVVALPYTGSRAVVGLVDEAELAGIQMDGRTLDMIMREAGCLPEALQEAEWPQGAAAVVELHVEQGPVLDSSRVPLGVVTAVTGQQRGVIEIRGRANHAGTTPMAMRRDALAAAAELVLAVENLAGPGRCDVATVGRLHIEPGAANVIPGRVSMSFDVRSPIPDRTDAAVDELGRRAKDVGSTRGVEVNLDPATPTRPVAADPLIQDTIEIAASQLGLESLRMPSGAGHDCAILARNAPFGMIFVPSTGGVSHHGSEATPDAALVDGARVLLRCLIDLDSVIDVGGANE
jgi:beta-ureidopropionase / N-carbamoyl-L-amino-acid hydrolase